MKDFNSGDWTKQDVAELMRVAEVDWLIELFQMLSEELARREAMRLLSDGKFPH